MRLAHTVAASLSAIALGLTPVSVLAQDLSLPATYGETALEAGFQPDPFMAQVDAGGPINAAQAVSGCAGWIANAPDYRIMYAANGLPLAFTSVADQDSTLVINAPDGTWHCDDDSGGNGNPAIVFPQPMSGQFDVWVGSYVEGAVFPAVLGVTEILEGGADGSTGVQQFAGAPGADQGGSYGTVDLVSGFTPDPFRAQIMSGGAQDAASLVSGCVGYIADQADYQVNYTAGSLPLVFSVSSMGDTTLVVYAPNGQFYCDDDSGNGDLNPSISFQAPMSGTYMVWVGSYAQGEFHNSSLSVSELYSE